MCRRIVPSAVVVGALLQVGFSVAVSAQVTDGPYRFISSKESKFQAELDRAAADGYRLVAGDASVEIAVFERATDARPRAYLFVQHVEKFLKDARVQPGFRFIAPTFAADRSSFSAIMEKVDGDGELRDYRLVKADSNGALRKQLEAGLDGPYGLVAVAAGPPGSAALVVRRAEASKATLIDSGVTATIRDELGAAATRGYCIVDSDGVKQALYALEECAHGPTSPAYEVISTTKTETLERELNAAAKRGLRFLPGSLVGIQKRVPLMGSYNNETVAVVQPAPPSEAVTYRVLGTVRPSTFEKELNAAGSEGFTLAGFAIGPKELVAVLEKK